MAYLSWIIAISFLEVKVCANSLPERNCIMLELYLFSDPVLFVKERSEECLFGQLGKICREVAAPPGVDRLMN